MNSTKVLAMLLSVVFYGFMIGNVLAAGPYAGMDNGTTTYGVRGFSNKKGHDGVQGESIYGDGVVGKSHGSNKSGVYAISTKSDGFGLFARNIKGGYAIYSSGDLGVQGSLLAINTSKPFVGPFSSAAILAVGAQNGYAVYSMGNMYVSGSFERENLASTATVKASSEYNSNYAAGKVNDGLINRWDAGEWASKGEGAGAWVQLDWGSPQDIGEVWLYDRPNEYDQVLDAMLLIKHQNSSISKIHLGMFPYGGAPKKIKLTKTEGSKVVALQVYVIKAKNTTLNVGLSEIVCYR